VLLDVPEDVCHGSHDFTAEDFAIDPTTLAIPARRNPPDRGDIERAARLIASAKRPLLLVGGGIHLSQGYAALAAFAEAQAIPVAHTMSGKGGIPCIHPLSVGLFGRYARIANELIDASDCLIVVGCKLGEIATKRYAIPAPHIPIIHLEIVAEEIGRCHAAEVALWGDARAGIEDLAEALAGDAAQARRARADYVAEIPHRMAAWEEEASPRLNSRDRPVHMARLCRELNRALPADAILVADGGFAGHWTGLLYDTSAPGGSSSRTAASPRSATACRAASARRWRRRNAGRLPDWRWRVQHDARRTRNRAPRRARLDHRRRQQRRLGLCEGLTACDDGRPVSVRRSLGDGLCRDRPHDGRRRHPGRGSRTARRRARRRHGRARPPDVVDVVVTRDPGQMLPAVDNRTVEIRQGDRVA